MTMEQINGYDQLSEPNQATFTQFMNEDEQDEDQEDLAWSIAAAYSWVSDEDED